MGVYKKLVRQETKDKAERAIKLNQSGKSVAEIAKILGLSKSRIYELLKKRNWHSKG